MTAGETETTHIHMSNYARQMRVGSLNQEGLKKVVKKKWLKKVVKKSS